ncbi:hypothetical protein F511_13557 [Dorcoceras hygrometricum]|uniref:Uncharacterized protein n=1 Tax=Dorcoceras hygrometricum TaxID=472368 RepID=A0A2Z7C1R0_9LAMI|nr:hypothetical protein F511_13557 [Dorcoceras hygrometricum]
MSSIKNPLAAILDSNKFTGMNCWRTMADPDPVFRGRLAPTSFTRKPTLQTVGGGRSSIRSTIGINLPPSICTRRSDGFCHGRNLLVAVIETSPITRQAEGGDTAEARRPCVRFERRGRRFLELGG